MDGEPSVMCGIRIGIAGLAQIRISYRAFLHCLPSMDDGFRVSARNDAR